MLVEDKVEVNRVNWRMGEHSGQRLVGKNTEERCCDAHAKRCFIQCSFAFP